MPNEEMKKINIAVEEEVWQKTFHLIDQNPLEVCWLGLVRFEPETLSFVWYDILVPGQTSRPTTFDVSTDQAGSFFEDLINGSGQTHQEIAQWFPHLKLHGHSHVYMGVEASDTDDRFISRIISKSAEPYYLRVIGNKRGMLQFTLFLPQEDAMIIDVPWSIRGENYTRHQEWAKEISKARVQQNYYGLGPGAFDFDPASWRRYRPLWPAQLNSWQERRQDSTEDPPGNVPVNTSQPDGSFLQSDEDCWLVRIVRAVFGLNSIATNDSTTVAGSDNRNLQADNEILTDKEDPKESM